MKSVLLTVFAAAGALIAGTPSFASDRYASRQYTPVRTHYTTPVSNHYTATKNTQSAAFEEKCLTLSCGSRWCYKVRR